MMSGIARLPSVDVDFLQTWSPARFAAAGVALYAVLLVISPLEYDYSLVTLNGTIYAAIVLVAFFGGCLITKTIQSNMGPATPQPVRLPANVMVTVALVVGFVGVVARLYDRVILRGFTIAQTYFDTRETIAEGLTPFSYIGGIFFSFGMVALALVWLSSSQRRYRFVLPLAAFLALYPMIESLVQGSRSTMLHTAFLFFMFARSSKAMPWLTRSKTALVVLAVAMVGFAELIYEIRSLQGAGDEEDIADVFKLTAIANYARPPDWIIQTLIDTNGHGIIGGPLKVWTHFLQYMTHSWFAYYDSFAQFQGVYGWGRMDLYMPLKVISSIVGEDLTYDPGLYGMQNGVSGTVFSSIYYDFGFAGPLVAALFGIAATMIQRAAIMHPERWLPLHVYLCFACLALMVDNQLIGSLGAFAVWSFALYVPLHFVVSALYSQAEDLPAGDGPGAIGEFPEKVR